MKVSVVMTVYGREEYLKEAIESIGKQTFSDFEFLIVVENGVDSYTHEIIKKCALVDDRIRLIYNTTRKGLAESLNIGIRQAKGEYIARMDDDDFSDPCRFEKQVRLLDKKKEVGICGTLQKTVRPDGQDILLCACEPEELKAEMLFGCQLSHTSVMFRKKLFEENRWFYDGNKLAEDFDLWTRILNNTKMENLNEVLVLHRYGFGNISIEKGERLYEENVLTIRKGLEKYLGIDSSQWSKELFSPWRSCSKKIYGKNITEFLVENMDLIEQLEKSNKEKQFCLVDRFEKVLNKRLNQFLAQFFNYWKLNETRLLYSMYEYKKNRNQKENLICFFENFAVKHKINNEFKEVVNDFLSIESGKQIIIYGMGAAYQSFISEVSEEKIKDEYVVLGYSDSNEDLYEERANFIKKNQLNTYMYDYILISTGRYYNDIRKELIESYHVSPDKIGLLEQIYPKFMN